MRTALLIFFISFSFAGKICSQEYLPVTIIEPFEGSFTTDHLGNIFRYFSGDVIRYDSDGVQTGTFSSREFGDVSYVDATNPMKILVVYEKFSKAVLLDNSMAANTTFNLVLEGIPAISLICTSRDGGFWIFDPQANQLKKINDQLGVISEGTNLRQVTSDDIKPVRVLDSGNWIILYAAGHGFLIFDRYGTYYKTIKSDTGRDFQVHADEVIFKEGEKINITDIKSGRVRTFLLPENKADEACRVESKRIYIQQLNTLKIYSY